MAKITYVDKVFLNQNSEIADANKVTNDDLNEIKNVVNQNDDNIGDLSNLDTKSKDNIVNAINEINNYATKDIIVVNRTTRQHITNTNSTTIIFDKIKYQKGKKLTLVDGCVKIGKGIKTVKASCLIWAEAFSGYSNINISLKRGDSVVEAGGANIFPGKYSQEWRSQSIANCFFDVQEGDEIVTRIMFSSANSSNNVAGNYANSNIMSVEVVEYENI